MLIKLDENITSDAVALLRALGHDVETVESEGLTGAPDDRIIEAVAAEGRVLVTQDLDFSDVRRLASESITAVVILRLADPNLQAIAARVLAVFRTIPEPQFDRALVVVTDRKIRIRRFMPPASG